MAAAAVEVTAAAATTTAAASVAADMNAARTGNSSRNISILARLHMRNAGAYMAVRSTRAGGECAILCGFGVCAYVSVCPVCVYFLGCLFGSVSFVNCRVAQAMSIYNLVVALLCFRV